MKKEITKICYECGGLGEFSSCCGEEIHNRKCAACSKFCKIDMCYNCNGQGIQIINLKTEVELFVDHFSPEYIKKQFKRRIYTYYGKVVEILDKNTLKCKFGNKIVEMNIQDINTA